MVAFAILRDTLSAQRRAKVLSMLNGITCIIPVLAPVVGYLIMLKFPWQSLFWTMAAMGAIVFILSVTVLKETHPGSQQPYHTATLHPAEKLVNRFFLSRLAITTLSVAVILTYVNVSPVLLMETMGFDRGEYSTVMALTAMVSMAVSFSTPFALNIFRQRTLMLTSQTLFLAAGVIHGDRHLTRCNAGGHYSDLRRILRRLWCGDESGAWPLLAAGRRGQLGAGHCAGLRFFAMDLAGGGDRP